MLDSNLIIYAARPEYPGLRRLIAARSPAVSTISVVEVLGYHKLSEEVPGSKAHSRYTPDQQGNQ